MASRTTAPDPAPVEPPVEPDPTGDETRSDEPAFFAWLRRLDLPRRPGWLGGVCAGVAERIGVDPVLVRGVVVVIAVLGAPVALLYAAAWFLLPDEHGTIHARELSRGHVTRAVPGIAAVFLLSFLPLAQGFWFAGAFYWSDLGAGGTVLRVLWTAALIVLGIVAVVWLARRAASSDITVTPATTDDRPDTVPGPGEPVAPPEPPADTATADELAAWRRGQDEWRAQRATWAAEQRRTERERRAADARERSRTAFADARERERVERLTRPRAHPGAVALVLGVALVAGAIAAAVAQADPAARGAHWVVGAATLVLVLGVGIVVVGLARRRSAGLTSLSITAVVLLALSIAAYAFPVDRTILPLSGGYGLDRTEDGSYWRLAGSTDLWVRDRPDGEAVPVIDLWQVSGSVAVQLDPDAAVRIEVVTESPGDQLSVVEEYGANGGRTSFFTLGGGAFELTAGAGAPDAVFRVHVGHGVPVSITYRAPEVTDLPLDREPDERFFWGGLENQPTDTEGAGS